MSGLSFVVSGFTSWIAKNVGRIDSELGAFLEQLEPAIVPMPSPGDIDSNQETSLVDAP